jgi:RNA polymerase sigma-70 factor (ECF subfamily)
MRQNDQKSQENQEGQAGWLAEQFEQNRGHLRGVAYRMLGSATEADDAVQEAWLRLSRTSADGIDNLGGWLTTVLARVCLDMLRSRKARREESLNPEQTESVASGGGGGGRAPIADPEREALLADSVGMAMLLVLNALAPPERIAFVLHDMFGVSFEDIAPIVGRNAAAARQLASRARRRVHGTPVVPESDLARQREVVDAFLAAARGGDFDALLNVLDPEVVVRGDRTAVAAGGSFELRGAAAVARSFLGKAQAARPVLVDGALGVAVVRNGALFIVLRFRIADGKIGEIQVTADHDQLDRVELAVLPD